MSIDGRREAGAGADLRLYGLLDTGVSGLDGGRLAAMAAEAVAGGCTLLQYREKAIPDARAALARIRAIRTAVEGRVPVLVNDRVDLALAAGAEGVHLGQSDLHPADARRLLGTGAIVGLTLKTGAQADELYRLPVDYACIGGVFATASKDNPDPPVGLDGLRNILFRARLARGREVPLGAIAGIDASNAAAVIAAGADGIAVISSLFAGSDVEARARDLRARVDAALAERGGA
ncbi:MULTISPECIES: thiamine phosphate synthase [Methylobacterium]|uniref:Thiamine-phosphate synthase n=3 Tax=Pseudomonadota TaxID=1224 RepID=A0ABQ4SNU6_9HYPH|nr:MULTISPECIES: thiamine phosphate synthase [Methylobacterium]PIU06679.1 MAG: thiamine phosphate synthase [Methylobacterium sp. CG09_land_8_20_14_0_10_71_15]PIU12061.1 MAG: thiamine phosphate synthase [Methylobacterium sp. CG08_land_8_20_14_0_20_71_15]GBU19259.1 thiamine-phosphate synthase [Methylobacterium sp.]GJE04752.1 Thiamine-phosphate synthase [Methylobacterium jeotgali]